MLVGILLGLVLLLQAAKLDDASPKTQKPKIEATYYVCRTGDKEQYYTLYIDRLIRGAYGYFHTSSFIQNLAHNKTEAKVKAQAIRDKAGDKGAKIKQFDSARPVFSNMEAFGITMKMSRRRTVWYGHINDKAFWDDWRENKADIKAAGYWVMKSRDSGQWLLFRKVPEEMLKFASDI
tara:strand:+ start:516 stop:1049 length:534 start_codon:yes stop_codon:yes gene_type:complete